MKIAFVDIAGWDYDADTPFVAPMGGTQSAAVYLAAELAQLGLDVTFVNRIVRPRMSRDVRFVNSDSFDVADLNQFDAIIVLSATIGHSLRSEFRVTKPLILWNHVAPNDESIANLKSTDEQRAWTAVVVVSDWHAGICRSHFGLSAERIVVMRNAVSPAFLETVIEAPWFLRGVAPTLVYTSAPYRGLTVLTTAFPTIRKALPDVRLRVFSSMAPYPRVMKVDHHEVLYELCRSLPGVDYVGAIPQRALAQELSGAAALAYPSIFPETSSIAMMEAMASGAMVLSTDIAALPETAAGFGHLLPVGGNFFDMTTRYATMVVDALSGAIANPRQTAERLRDQVQYARSNYSWRNRAKEWLEWLPNVTGRA